MNTECMATHGANQTGNRIISKTTKTKIKIPFRYRVMHLWWLQLIEVHKPINLFWTFKTAESQIWLQSGQKLEMWNSRETSQIVKWFQDEELKRIIIERRKPFDILNSMIDLINIYDENLLYSIIVLLLTLWTTISFHCSA